MISPNSEKGIKRFSVDTVNPYGHDVITDVGANAWRDFFIPVHVLWHFD